MTIKDRPAQLGPQRRTATLRVPSDALKRGLVDAETRTVDLVFASETPVDMWYGTEILSCAPGAMRTGTRQQSLPLLFNHRMDDLLGIVESISLGTDRLGHAQVRFGKDERGEWAMQQADDGVLVNVSFMYRVYRWEEDVEEETLTALDWEPYEISLVTVPADPAAGVGRSADACTENAVQITKRSAPIPASSTQPLQADLGAAQTTNEEENAMHVRMLNRRLREQAEPTTTTTPGNVAPPVDSQRAQQQGAEAERARIAEIDAMCRTYNIPAEVKAGMISRGATTEQARVTAADLVLQRSKGQPSADFGHTANPDLTESEKGRYSMIRAINAALTGDWSKAGFELECSNEVSKRSGRAQQSEKSFFIPTNIPFGKRTAYAVGTPGTGTAGGTLVATNLLASSFIEVLRNKARVMQLGATVLSGLVGSVDIPRQTGQTSSFWTAEGTNTTESEGTFDKVSLAMKTIGTYSQISRNMLMQSTPDIDMIVRNDLMAALGLGIDLAALSGSGSGGQPTGIANQAGIGSVVGGTNGAAVTIDNMIDLETQVTSSNAPEDSLAYLVNAKTVGSLKKLKSTTGQYLWTNAPGGGRSGTPGEINGYPVARSNQARSTLTKGTSSGVCSEIFFGAWSEVVIGEWGVLEIVPNPYDAAVFKNGGVLLRALQSVDIAVRHGASFATMSDALTP
jgi:HK97 family phage major capsid protein/HK97 family phage prohead protease